MLSSGDEAYSSDEEWLRGPGSVAAPGGYLWAPAGSENAKTRLSGGVWRSESAIENYRFGGLSNEIS